MSIEVICNDQKNSGRLEYLDGLRGLAALMVVSVHSANFIPNGILPGTILSWLKLGRFGVQAFYILSGFTILMSLKRLLESGGGIKTFYLRRFFRIAPLWWLALGMTYVYNLLIRNQVGSVGSVLSHIVAMHGLFPQYISDIIGQGWSVSIEVFFYLLVPFIVKKCGFVVDRYIKVIFFCSISSWLLGIAGDRLLALYMPNAEGSFFYLWLPNQMSAFLVGIVLYLIIIEKLKIENWEKTSIYVIAILLEVFLSLSEVLFRSLIIAAVIVVLSNWPSKLISNGFFRFVGKISYGIYLSHVLVIFVLQDLGFMSLGWNFSLIVYFVLVPILSMVIGTAAYYFIERPLLFLERRIEKEIN